MNILVRNHLAQPVELHLAERTVVLSPYGTAELSKEEAAERHVRHMCETGWLGAGEQAQPRADTPAREAPPKRAAAKRAHRS